MTISPHFIKILNKLQAFGLVIGVGVLVTVSGFSFFSNNLQLEAASIPYQTGTVNLDKYYLNGNSEVKTLTIAPGNLVTVRLKYNNTSPLPATNAVLTDSLPGPKFTYTPGSLKNCLINQNTCAPLSDTLVIGQNIVVSPSAGFYGYSNSAVTGNLEAGKQLYSHQVICSQTSGRQEAFYQTFNNTSIFVPSCASVGGGSAVVSYSSPSLLGNRYLHQTICTYPGGETEIFENSINNSLAFTPSCSQLTGAPVVSSSATLDFLGNRYLHQTICNQPSGEKEIFTQAVNSSPTFVPNCTVLAGGSSVSSSQTIDLYSNTNASGYIEYSIKANIDPDPNSAINVDIGNYGVNPQLSSSDFTSFSDTTMLNSLSVKVFCDTLNPTGAQRNLTLSDAEVRAGQDFRCNYLASLCPVVFNDLNSNGIFDGSDTLIPGTQVQLQTPDGTTTYDTKVTTSGAICFPELLHGNQYRLNLSTPPPGNSTTGGNFKTQLINYQSSTQNVFFGYTNGTLILNVPPSVTLPSISVSNKETTTTTAISPIQVIDTRPANAGWTLTATVNNFVAAAANNATIPVANKFTNSPGSVTTNSGQTGGIGIGNVKTISSTADPISIFSGSVGSSLGDYQISSTISLQVPPFSLAASYQTLYTYTII